MKKMSIKTSILLPVLLVLIVGIIIMVVIIGSISSSTTNDLSNRLVSARVNEYTNDFEAMCMESYGSVLSLVPVVQNLADSMENPREEVIKILTEVLMMNENMLGIWTCWEPNTFDGKDSEYTNALYHDSTGRYIPYIYRDGNGYAIAPLESYDVPGDGEYYLGAKNSGKPYITDPFEYNIGGNVIPLYSIAMPIFKDNIVVGVIGIDIRLDDIISVINKGSIMDEGYLFILSPEGLFTTHPNNELLLKRFETTWMADFKQEISSILSAGGEISCTAFSDQLNENINFLALSVMIGDTGRYWAVCGVVPERVVAESSTLLVWLAAITGLLLILFVGLTIFIIIRNRLKGLPIITITAENIAKGMVNITGLDSGGYSSKNEITLLSRAFASMVQGVKSQADVMTKIADGDYSISVPVRSNEDVINKAINSMIDHTNQIMHEISASSTQMALGSKQIADGSQVLAQGSTQQSVAVEELSGSIAEIAQKTKNNAEMANQAAKLANTIMDTAQKGNSQMNTMMEAVKEINNASQSISNVIKVIDDIAFQTNILALNASVEAARAGQHGKGFAVVAEEVRNLAAKSAEAAKNTGELISESMAKTELGVNIADETAKSLKEIVTGINESGQLINQIARSSEEQSLSISHINQGIDQVTQVVQQNSATAQESAASSEEMSGQADLLDNLIAQFKLKDINTLNFNELSNNVKTSPKPLVMLEKPSYEISDNNEDYGKY